MCEAIVRGILAKDSTHSLMISEAYETRCIALRQLFPHVHVTSSNAEVANASEVVVIAVKPQQLATAFRGMSVTANPLFISICAGVTIEKLEGFISQSARISRVMPNLPAMVGEGASGFCLNAHCQPGDVDTVKYILGAAGSVVEHVTESLMDAVTGVSGSGPAYVCLLIEALADAGVKHGLARDVAIRLAAQTCVGAGKMVLAGGESSHPAVLKDKICSPGGTTIAAVAALEDRNFRAAAMSAVSAAVERAQQLGKL